MSVSLSQGKAKRGVRLQKWDTSSIAFSFFPSIFSISTNQHRCRSPCFTRFASQLRTSFAINSLHTALSDLLLTLGRTHDTRLTRTQTSSDFAWPDNLFARFPQPRARFTIDLFYPSRKNPTPFAIHSLIIILSFVVYFKFCT